jgi:formiminotetrahydrofolate cyclodeaminase
MGLEALVKEFDAWLNDVSNEPLPGGVAVAAAASAMGAALVAKAVRVTLERQSSSEADLAELQAVLDLAQEQQGLLLELGEVDEKAFRVVLDRARPEVQGQDGRQAWQMATDVPIRVAEACQALLAKLPWLSEICWPAVFPDLKTGGWLLEAGKRAGLLSAESNLHLCGSGAEAQLLRARMDALTEDEKDD